MKWYDRPRKGRLYRTWYRVWLGSWNLNGDLYPLTRRVGVTRPTIYNTQGGSTFNGVFLFALTIFLAVCVLIAVQIAWTALFR